MDIAIGLISVFWENSPIYLSDLVLSLVYLFILFSQFNVNDFFFTNLFRQFATYSTKEKENLKKFRCLGSNVCCFSNKS